MKWLIIVACSLALLITVIVIIGAMLPRDHIASRQAHFGKSVDAVFAIITDFSASGSWRPEVNKVELLAPRDGKTTYREWGKNGPRTLMIESNEPPRRLVSRIVDESAFGGTWTYELTPSNDGCRVAITERGEVYNPVFRFVGHFFFSPTASMEAYLLALGKKLGQSVTPEPT